MTVRPAASRLHRSFHAALLGGASILAMAGPADAVCLGRCSGGGAVTSAVTAAANSAIISAQQAAAATQQSMNSLTRATQALQAMQAAQTAAHNLAASTPSNVPNGLATGGLVPDSGLAGPGVANPVSSWVGVNTPTQTTSGNQTQVTVVQTQSNAIANWSSFNVGTNTLVYFNQSAGNTSTGNNWVILNRVSDPSGVPSQILGQIKAEGAVYLLNANGILFGGGSQINVQSLIASSLNLFSNTFGNVNTPGTTAYRFINGGIGDGTSAILLTSLAPAPGTAGPGNITVAPGASITVGSNGLALLAAPNVTNNGSITAPSGQVALVAGVGVSYGTSTNVGSGAVATTNLSFASYGNWVNASGNDITPVGSVINNGLIYTPSGNITLVGGAVAQNGVVIATTSAAQSGSIIVNSDYEASLSDATYYTGAVTFAPQAVTAVLPDPNSPPVKSDPTSLAPWQSVTAPGGFAVAPPTTQGPGFIAINGAAIDFQGGTLVYAPGQGLSVTATVLPDPRFPVPAADGRILIENGAVLDVSGIANTILPASYYVQQIILAGNELADSPLQQNSFLYGQTVTVNLALSGTNTETGEPWVGTPIANLASYSNQLNNSIGMLLKNGGAISLTGNEVVAETGSVVNLMGGYIHYLGGTINTTELVGSDGRIYNIGSANPNLTYIGIAGEFAVDHNVGGKPDPAITQYYGTGLLGAQYQPDYIRGGNGGTLSITVGSVNGPLTIPNSGAFVFDATLLAGALAGEMQVSGHNLPTAGSFTFVGVEPIEIGSANTLSGTGLAALAPPAGFGFSSPLLASPGSAYAAQNVISSSVLDNAQLASITLSAGSGAGVAASGGTLGPQPVTEDAGAVLAVQPLGSITLNAGTATINGTLTARGGSITINTTPGALVPDNIVVASGAVLDVSGFFINDQSLAPGALSPDLPVNAGTIALVVPAATSQSSATGGLPPATATDLSGNITLAAGSLLNLQGGGHVNASGQLVTSNGVPVGSGGNLTLETYAGLGSPLTQGLPPLLRGVLTLDGTIEALGFSGGGTLTLEQPAFQIGGNPATAGSAYYFNPTQWGALGFGSFVLTSIEGAVVPAGAVVTLQHQNLIANAAILSAPSGANPAAFATPGLLIGTQRSPTNLTISAGQETLEQALQTTTADDSAIVGLGAQILGDPGASISISSTMALTMLGTIRAPGGTVSLAVNVPSTQNGVPATITPAGPLYLGPQSVVDVSGTVVMNPVPQTLSTGMGVTYTTEKVLAGGTINLTDNETSILVAPGAILNVSGAAGTLNVPQFVLGGPLGGQRLVLTQQPQWSDAGAININGEMGLLFEGTLIGHGGAPQANGATLTVTVDNPPNNALSGTGTPLLILVEDTAQAITASGATFNFSTFVPTTKGYSNANEEIDPKIPALTLLLGADSLNGSGISNLLLNGPGGFAGQVSLTLGQSIVYNNGGYLIAANAGNFTWSGFPPQPRLLGGAHPTNGASLTLNAPYVSLVGVTVSGGGEQPSPGTATDATLTVNAGQIDISEFYGLINIGLATFNSSGAIRFLPSQALFPSATQLGGYLVTPGNLVFNAAEVYPATDTVFVIQSSSPTGSITFNYAPGVGPTTAAPLSADGGVVVSAATIVQNGEIQAPFGSIVLGLSAGTTSTPVSGFNLPATVVQTQSVTLGAGSITSVSAGGSVIPFGTTVDQTTWIYNPVTNNPTMATQLPGNVSTYAFAQPVTAAPQGVVAVTGSTIALNSGATINISGGGDLQAAEWVPGTGGSRNVLAQFNTSYASSITGTQVSLYPDGRQIYAILPGFTGKIAPYDATVPQLSGAVGQEVYLNGGPGLPAGYYTLLPASYATLPGAFRVVANSGVTNPQTNQTLVLPDGTMEMEGYFGNALSGSRSSNVQQFYVQSQAVWGQYSQYVYTSANSFFPAYATLNNLATPVIPNDAGRLVLSATSSITFGAQLIGTPGPGGTGSQLDISAQLIQIVGQGEAVQPGYLAVSAAALESLGADSVLIGGVRSNTTSGILVTPTATDVIISTDAADPLTAPEILLTAAPQFVSTTIKLDNDGDTASVKIPVANTGSVTVDSGSVIRTAAAANNDVGGETFILGNTLSTLATLPSNTDATNASATKTVITNDYATLDAALGTLVLMSSGRPGTIQLPSAAQLNPGTISVQDNVASQPGPIFTVNLPSLVGTGGGIVIQSGASITAGNTLALETTGNVSVQTGTKLSATNITAVTSNITFLAAGQTPTAGFTGMAIDTNLWGTLSQASNLNLQSYGGITFQGGVNLQMAASGGTLTLGGGVLTGTGSDVTITASTLVLDNTMNAPTPATPTPGTSGALALNVGELIFGSGTMAVAGFGGLNPVTLAPNGVTVKAQQAVIGEGSGTTNSMNFGALPVTLQTPTLIAGTASTETLTTTGAFSVTPLSSVTAATASTLGGAITLQGGSVSIAVPVQAVAGNITLQSSAGDITVQSGGQLIANGLAQTFGPTTEYAPGGLITLSATGGTVNIQSGALVNFSGAAGGGNGGSLSITATGSTPVSIAAGALSGVTAPGATGSSFSLTTANAPVALDTLAEALSAAGITGSISVESGQGALVLNQTLTANSVKLIADAGLVTINGTINVSGAAGGTIALYGTSGVDVEGSLIATGTSGSGGTVTIGTSASFNQATGTYNSTSGYENIAAANSGTITFGPNAKIELWGGVLGSSQSTLGFGVGNADITTQTNLGLTTGQIIDVIDAASGRYMVGTVSAYNAATGDLQFTVTNAYGTGFTGSAWTIANPAAGGTLALRAPLLANGGVNLSIASTAVFTAPSAATLEAYAVWSTADQTTGAQHFDGIIDPAGWYSSSGVIVQGTFVNGLGTTVATTDGSGNLTNLDGTSNNLNYYLTSDYFVPTNPNTAHETFYGYQNGNSTTPGTLMGFVQAPGFQSVANSGNIANFHQIPGIELDNPATGGVNNGAIQVLSNWNLGAANASGNLVFRYNGLAPVVTIRAGGNLQINASISDGFIQPGTTLFSAVPLPTNVDLYANALSIYNSKLPTFPIATLSFLTSALLQANNDTAASLTLQAPTQLVANPNGYDQYYKLWETYESEYATFYADLTSSLHTSVYRTTGLTPATTASSSASVTAKTDATRVINDLATVNSDANFTTLSGWSTYEQAYSTYVGAWNTWATAVRTLGIATLPQPLLPPPLVSIRFVPVVPPVPSFAQANSPNVVASQFDQAAIAGMALSNEASSSSYRLVAGADLASADPLALNFAVPANVSIGQHTSLQPSTTTLSYIVMPTIVRTGTGSIDIAASGDFDLTDPLAPGVVYTAGQAPTAPTASNAATVAGITILTGAVNAFGGGNITITALGNINGIENVTDTLATGSGTGISGTPGAFIGQFWAPWLLGTPYGSAGPTNPTGPSVAWYVNFGSFDQGIMSVGGDITVSAGGNIKQLAVSTPTTGFLDSSLALHVTGGGNLTVTAGGSILSGDFYVGQGTGTISAANAIAPDPSFTFNDSVASLPVPTLLAVQYATINVSARQSVNIGGIYDPTYIFGLGTNGSYTSPVQSGSGSSTLFYSPYFTTMSPTSGVSIQSTAGNLLFNSLLEQVGLFNYGSNNGGSIENIGSIGDSNIGVSSLLLPASLNLVAIEGAIDIQHGGGLYPSATGTLSVVADQSITLALPFLDPNGAPPTTNTVFSLLNIAYGPISGTTFGKLDEKLGDGILPTAAQPVQDNVTLLTPAQLRDPSLSLPTNTSSVLIYSQNGSFIDGSIVPQGANFLALNTVIGGTLGQISLIPNAPSQIYAGGSILNLPFYGENFTAGEVTGIQAGLDISTNILSIGQPAAIELAGPGTLEVIAGRNINFESQRLPITIALAPAIETGIRTIGNQVDTGAYPDPKRLLASGQEPGNTSFTPANQDFGNPYLPAAGSPLAGGGTLSSAGASVFVLFGVGPGVNYTAFIADYLNPATAIPFAQSLTWQDLDFAGNPIGAALTPAQNWAKFQTLTPAQQKLQVLYDFFAILNETGLDYNNQSSPYFHTYANGYTAINTLFPSAYGYTANNLGGGTNGANQIITTGNFDMRGSTVQTEQGGNISVLGPGGRILVGSAVASPAVNPASEGILTLESGNISTFTNTDVLVAQSRVMTEQGGNILMWSSNGNLDAGKGAKTSVSAPPPRYDCALDWVCTADIKGEVSGAGIATLQSKPGVPTGNANLIAPRGTIDAGAAGIRVSGNLNIVALQVLNTFNIQVQGVTVGLPTAPAPNIGALTTASNTAAATQATLPVPASGHNDRPSVIIVEVVGYGGGDGETKPKEDQQRQNDGKQSYNQGQDPRSRYQVIGVGELTDDQAKQLTERRRVEVGR